jgi:hypothetical protein
LRSGPEALETLERLKPLFHPDPSSVEGALENQFGSGPREVEGAGGASYAIGGAVLRYLAALAPSQSTSIETGCGYTTVVLANVFATHISVNPDLASNRLVREFVERHCGATGLQHVETSSDQGLPGLVADGRRVDLALIDGNHSHPFPLLDFHYLDQLLNCDGLLLVDNTEIPAVQELIDYLEFEGAYRSERAIGNCAVYRKVRERQFGWKSQTLRRPPGSRDAVHDELTRLRMDVTPELRASLSGANPLPGWPDEDHVPIDTEPSSRASRRHSQGSGASARRRVGQLARWYLTPSGLLAGAALALLAVGLAAPGLYRLIAVAGVILFAVFLPYRFLREQRRTDRQIASVRVDVGHQIGTVNSRSRRTDTELARASARVGEVQREIAALRQMTESAHKQVPTSRDGISD